MKSLHTDSEPIFSGFQDYQDWW